MNIDKHATIARLRSAIRTQESLSRDLRAQVNTLRSGGPATGPQRHALHMERQAIGQETRLSLLALAMVRGRAYRSQEPKADSTPAAFYLACRALGAVPYEPGSWKRTPAADIAQTHAATVAEWVKGGPSPVTHAEPMAVAA